jgi:hypothetical protein
MQGTYCINQETQKLELHFEKADYMALPADVKAEINRTFLWSGKSKAWVSRSINSHWRAEEVAKKLGLENAGKVGTRKSYAEELEVKAEKATARAEKYDQYSANAEKRAESLQSDFNKYRKDWSWLTQPIIAGHRGSQAFARHKEKVMKRYEKGFEEYKKSEYFQDRAATARATADNAKLRDRVYLDRKIKESNKTLKTYQKLIGRLEDTLYRVQQGEELKNRSGEILTEERLENGIAEALEKYDWEYDKKEFFETHLAELGGIQFSKENIKPGYIVTINHSGRRCEILTAGPVNVTYKILDGGASGMVLTDPYAAIVGIVEAKEKADEILNPYKVDDILCKYRPGDNSVYKAYQVIKVTAYGVKIQQIAVENNIPIPEKVAGEAPMQKKVVKSKFSDFVGVYDGDWQLHKYTPGQ